jgi:epoxyqueuosine reductase
VLNEYANAQLQECTNADTHECRNAEGATGLTRDRVKARALELGFDACGIAPAVGLPELGALGRWLDRGYNGSMSYLRRTARKRGDVRQVLASARSVVSTATLYHTDRPLSIEQDDPTRATFARYAWGEDYHLIVGERLGALAAWMDERSDEPFEGRTSVDHAPIQERVYARHAGIGWIGKNTCTISPRLGSFIVLGEIVCNVALEPDEPSFDQCGECTLCLEACPTGALVEPGVLDARRCISYLTIEHRGVLPAAWQKALGSHIFGCDICQDVCPWNAGAPTSADPAWQPRPTWDAPKLTDLWHTGETPLAEAIEGSAMARATAPVLRRNIGIALDNAGLRTSTSPGVGLSPSKGRPD